MAEPDASAGDVDGVLFAAGLGTRLQPLTADRPKALVDVAGQTLLARVARRMVAAGVTRLVINTHPFPEDVRAEVARHEGFGIDVRFSHEVGAPLETGGGIRHAARELRGDRAVLVHNVDVLSAVDLAALLAQHRDTAARGTLAVMERSTSRRLRFDDLGLLGREDDSKDLVMDARSAEGTILRLPFLGIQVLSPIFIERIEEAGAFSILVPLLREAAARARLLPFVVAPGTPWLDVGTVERHARAEQLVAEGTLS